MQLKLLDVEKFVKGLTPVTTAEIRTRTGEFHIDGLFSEKIFGVEGREERNRKYSFINLNAYIVHPAAYRLLLRIDRRLDMLFSTEESFSITTNGLLIQDDNGISGISEFISIFPKIKLKGETTTRNQIIKVLQNSYKEGTLFVNKLPVIPVSARPLYTDESGMDIMDELNNVYISIIRKSTQIKTVGKNSSLFKLLNYYLQTAVLEHDKFIRAKLSKKTGLIRSSMLGKRTDFTARGVITPGPELKTNEIGVPLRMAVMLFEPFLIHYIIFSKKYPYKEQLEAEVKKLTELELSVDTLQRVIKSIKNADKVSLTLENLIFDATEIVIKGRALLTKRDPALHDGSYRAFFPKLIKGNTIQLSTIHVGGFNADFDGDAMALFHPLSEQAQKEAIEKMMRIVGSKHGGHIVYGLEKEMAVGLYTLTKNIVKKGSPVAVTKEILDKATDPYIPVRFRGRNTTMGRAIFNNIFPEDFRFIDQVVNKKIGNALIPELLQKYGEERTNEIFSEIKRIGFKFATIMAPSITLDMIDIPDNIMRLKSKLNDVSTEEAVKIIKQMGDMMKEHLKNTGLYDLIDSGAGKGWDQPTQILIAKGVISDPKGNILPTIKGSFAEGLTTKEFFEAASGARKGMADRALNTATTGYFTRQLVYVLGTVEAHPSLRDCGTKRLIGLRLTPDIIRRLDGRYVSRSGKLERFNKSEFKNGDSIAIRTPIFCESKKICHTCYGDLLKRHKSPYVGILAGASIGERGTQLIMRTFHTGGAANIIQHTLINDIVDNDPLIKVDVKNYFLESNEKLITKKDCKISIDLDIYKINDTIQFNSAEIWINHLIAKVEFENTIFNIMLDYPVNLQKINELEEIDGTLVLRYSSNDIVIEVPQEVPQIDKQINYVARLMGGRVVYKNPGHLITKIMKIYGKEMSDLDLVHFEILISQCLRDRKNTTLPARLGKEWDPVMMNIKSTVFESGFLQGLAFENINKAIETGLIGLDSLEPSLLGRLITGEVINK